MKLKSLSLLVLLVSTSSLVVRSQQSSFTVAGIKPFDKAVPGQVMDVMIEGLSSGAAPMVFPATYFKVEVSQDGVTQTARVRITKFTMTPEANPQSSNKNTIDFAGMKMRAYQAVSFVVPQGLHPGPAEVIVSVKGKRGNSRHGNTRASFETTCRNHCRVGRSEYPENTDGERYSTPVTKSFVLP